MTNFCSKFVHDNLIDVKFKTLDDLDTKVMIASDAKKSFSVYTAKITCKYPNIRDIHHVVTHKLSSDVYLNILFNSIPVTIDLCLYTEYPKLLRKMLSSTKHHVINIKIESIARMAQPKSKKQRENQEESCIDLKEYLYSEQHYLIPFDTKIQRICIVKIVELYNGCLSSLSTYDLKKYFGTEIMT